MTFNILFIFFHLACSCDKDGSVNNQCDIMTGECECLSNFNPDDNCLDCNPGHYKKEKGLCHGKYFSAKLLNFTSQNRVISK